MTRSPVPDATLVQARIHPRALGQMSRYFDATAASVFVELIQNARRAGASHVDIVADSADTEAPDDATIVTVWDNGRGIADPAVLLSFGESDWDGDLARTERAAGMGVDRVVAARLGGLRVRAMPDWSESGMGSRETVPGSFNPLSLTSTTGVIVMFGLNRAEVIGRLGADVTINHLTSGGRVANMSIATDEGYLDRSTGQRVDRTEWHRVVTFQPGLVDMLEKHATKGRLVYVSGVLQTRRYRKDGEDTDRFSTEIRLAPGGRVQFLDKPNGASGNGAQAASAEAPEAPAAPAAQDLDDEIPF